MVRRMKDSGVEWIGEIPEDWEVRKLDSIAELITDYVASGSFASLNENVQYLDEPDYAMLVRTVDLSGLQNKKHVYINQHAYEFLENSNLFGGEIILSNIGSVGNVYIYKPIYERASLAPNAIMVNMRESNRYYYYWFLSPLVNYALKQIGSNAVQCKFNKTQLRAFLVAHPSQNEQDQIADFLDEKVGEIDSVIARTKETIEDYKKYKQAIITDVVTKGLNPDVEMIDTNNEWIGKIPTHWSKIALKKVSTKPISYGVIKLFYPDENGVKILRCSDIKDGYIIEDAIRTITKELSNEYSRTILQSGDVVINVRGTLGGCAVVPDSMNGYNIAREVALVAINKEKYLSKYIMYCLLSKIFENFRDYSLSGCIYLGINMETLSKFMCPLPPLKEQEEIATYLDEKCTQIDRLIAKKEDLLADLESYKRSLMYEFVTGKKEVD